MKRLIKPLVSPIRLSLAVLGVTTMLTSTLDTSTPVTVMDGPYYAHRLHLTPAARAEAQAIETEFTTNKWAGTDEVTAWDTDQVASSVADFNSKFAALDTSLNNRIRLSAAGDWSSSQPYLYGKDFIAAGGSCRIEPESGTGPVLPTRVRLDGCRGVHFDNITFGYFVYIIRSATNPAWSVSRFSNCRIGATFQGETNYANYYFMSFNINNAEEVAIVDCVIDGSQAGVVANGVRRLLVDGVDFQRLGADCVNPKGLDTDIGGETFASKWPDLKTYVWVTRCTARAMVDDPAIGAVHTDFIQIDTAGSGTLDYMALFEFNVVNLARAAVAGVGTQGIFTNNEARGITMVAHSNIIGVSAYTVLSGYAAAIGNEYFFERNTCVRASAIYTGIDNIPWITGSGALATIHSTKNIAAAFTQNDSTFVSSGDVVSDPRIGSATPYTSVFAGPFTTDGEGRTAYNLNNTGMNSQADFRAEMSAIFTPIGDAIGAGAPDVAMWPV